MKGANDTIILIVWVAATIFSLVSSMNICGKTDETILISYNKSTSVDTIPWRLNGNPFYTSSFETDGLTCITTPPPPADYEVLCSNVKFSGFNYFGLKILKPQDGDYYYTTDPNDKRTIIVPEPATMTVDITSTITTDTVLPSTDTISMECQISNCTKPQPNIMWQYITVGGTGIPISNTYINSTLDATGCTGTLTKINSKVEIFRDSVPITDVPFQVICVLSYDLCPGNTFNETTDYTITITGTTEPEGLAVWIIVIIVIVIVIVIVIIIVIIMKKRKTDGAVPDPPLDINYKTRGADNIVVTWRAGDGNGGGPHTFIVQHSTDNKRWTNSPAMSATEYRIENLLPNTPYYIRVIASNTNGESDPEKGIHLLVSTTAKGPPEPPKPQAVPDPPLNINYKTRGTDNIVVTWGASGNGGDQQQFIVQQSEDNKRWTDSTTKPIPLTEYRIENLQPDTLYYIRVIARNKYGDSDPEEGIVLLVRTTKRDPPICCCQREPEDPENGTALTFRA